MLVAQLGKRPSKVPPKWYGLTRHVSVCPYCGGLVKLGQRGQIWLLLTFPFFLLTFISFFGWTEIADSLLYWLFAALALGGIFAFAIFIDLKKTRDP